jgi:hypothetical protein
MLSLVFYDGAGTAKRKTGARMRPFEFGPIIAKSIENVKFLTVSVVIRRE